MRKLFWALLGICLFIGVLTEVSFAGPTFTIGMGSAVDVADRSANFNSISTHDRIESYVENGIFVGRAEPFWSQAYVAYDGPPSNFPSEGGIGFDQGFWYGSGPDWHGFWGTYTLIKADDNSVLFGVEFNVGVGFSYNPFGFRWETYKDSIKTGEGTASIVKGTRVGITDPCGFDELRVGAFSSLGTAANGFDEVNAIALDNLEVKMIPENYPPDANAGGDLIAMSDVTLDGSQSSDPEAAIASYQWALHHRGQLLVLSAQGMNPTLSVVPPGFYDVTLTVTDSGGLVDTDAMVLAVAGECNQEQCPPCDPCPPVDAVAKIDAIMSFFNASIELGTIKPKVAASIRSNGDLEEIKRVQQKRIDAMNALLETAKRLIHGGFDSSVCGVLEGAYTRCDGQGIRPADWFKGDAVPEFAGMIQQLMGDFGCQ